MFFEVGVLFNIEALVEVGLNYRSEAWKIFLRTCNPQRLIGATLYEGDAREAFAHAEQRFCIAVQSFDQQVIDYLKTAFLHSQEPGLMPQAHRFLEGGVTLRFPLSIRAQIDQGGRFCSWNETSVRQDQWLCHEVGWGFGETARSVSTAA
jgi:hypothetical protein